jgi:ribosomal protein S18 acetylase RimI-like enzyme
MIKMKIQFENRDKLRIENMIIRHAEIADYVWLKNHDRYIPEEILKRKIELKEVYVVQEGSKLIGWLRYNLFWDSIPFMNMIYFLGVYRGKGLGKKLTYYWENEMKEKGFTNVLTSTLSNEEAQHFYRKIGYKEIGGFMYLNEPLEILFHKQL